VTLGQRFARLATDLTVRWPRLWPILRRPLRRMFDDLASTWGQRRATDRLEVLSAALEALPRAPRRVLDLGSGTGSAALVVARRWPEAEVVGVDVSAGMVEHAQAALPGELAGRVRYEVADAAALPFPDASFDLVVLANMIPFFDELARVVESGGHVVFSFSAGPDTPIYVEPERLRAGLGRRGFTDFAEFAAGRGTSLLARRLDRS
jgi:SAM-dependent methyltransferase